MAEEVAAWLREHGLSVEQIELDGQFHRVPGKKSQKKDGWYKGWTTPVLCCVAGDWATGQKWLWKPNERLTREQSEHIRRLQAEAAKTAESARNSDQERVSTETIKRLRGLPRALDTHPYLERKKIPPLGTFMLGESLYIPACDTAGRVWGAQIIEPNGKKIFHRSQRVSRTFFQIGELGAQAFICEGFATGATLHMATGIAVFCAWSSQNLRLTALDLKEKYPDVYWIIASDNDREKDGNPGVKAAQAAARAIDAQVIIPQFDRNDGGTDFNDLMVSKGLETVAHQLQGVQRPMATVTSIDGGKRKKKGSDDLSQAEFFLAVANKMNGDGPNDWPVFPFRFHVVRDDSGRKTVLEELSDEIVVYRDKEVVADAIYNYCWQSIPYEPNTRTLDAEKADKLKNAWMRLTPPLAKTPAAVLEKSERGLAFRRLPFDIPAGWDGAPPSLFEEILSRCSQPMAVCAFIGSLFYPEADRQQYLYLYGDGGDSKGALMRMLVELLAGAAVALQPPIKSDRFWNMNLYGKRLALFFDCDDWEWFRSPRFKSLTGNDPLLFEPKGRGGFTDKPVCKVIAASNSKPNISSQKADMRRLIFAHMRPTSVEEDPQYEAKLRGEAEAIIRTCKQIYLEECPRHGPIPFVQAIDVALETESDYLDLFYANFEVDPKSVLVGARVTKVLKEAGIRSTQEIGKVKDCWERLIPGVRIDHGERGARYLGMRSLTNVEIKADDPDDR